MTTKKACLYIRVSTDEQADKGFSQRDQAERLQSYAQYNGIDVVKIVFEDHSAKTFNRPEWIKILEELKKTKGRCFDVILFTKWDRFSRNTADAYQMIRLLGDYMVSPMAIEQPLDFNIPESKTILAVYLSMPEVENDRRALNVVYGMRRAKKEGRWMGKALHGYKNKITESGRKYIAPDGKQAELMAWCFEKLAEGVYAAEHVWMLAKEKGLTLRRAGFWSCIHNPIYCGKVLVPEFKDEEAYLVDGQHEAIISESTFYKVQDVIASRRTNRQRQGILVTTPDEFPLRGFMLCQKCGRKLTGSGSKGMRQTYYYYHCLVPCRQRFRVDMSNALFERELKKFIPRRGMGEVFKMVVCDIFSDESTLIRNERTRYSKMIVDEEWRISRSRELLINHALSTEEYMKIREEAEAKIVRFNADLEAIELRVSHGLNIEKMADTLLSHMYNLHNLYVNANTAGKRQIISSIFKGKWVFDGEVHHTKEINQAASLIYQLNNRLRYKKTGVKSIDDFNSGQVAGSRIELPTSGL